MSSQELPNGSTPPNQPVNSEEILRRRSRRRKQKNSLKKSETAEKRPSLQERLESLKECVLKKIKEPSAYGWVVVTAGFILHVPMMGFVMSFGELLPEMMSSFQSTTAELSVIGSLAFGMAYAFNPISSILYQMINCRWISTFGVIFGACALFVTSYVETTWHLYLTYGFSFGMATNMCYNPPLNLVGAWFPVNNHVLATSTIVAGVPFGSLVMNPVTQYLVQSFGLRVAFRLSSALVLIIGIPCALAFRHPTIETFAEPDSPDQPSPGLHIDVNENSSWLQDMIHEETDPPTRNCLGCRTELWGDVVFLLFLLGQFVKALGYVFPFIHLVNYMHSLHIDPVVASWIMTLKGFADLKGRLFAGVFGEAVGFHLVHVFVICTASMAVVTYMATFATEYFVMAVYAFCIGFFNGVYNSLLYPSTTSLFDSKLAKEAWAFCQVPPGLAIMIGPGMAGFIYDKTESYVLDFHINTIIFIVGMLIFSCIPTTHLIRIVAQRRKRGRQERPTIVEMTQLFIRGRADEDYLTSSDNEATHWLSEFDEEEDIYFSIGSD